MTEPRAAIDDEPLDPRLEATVQFFWHYDRAIWACKQLETIDPKFINSTYGIRRRQFVQATRDIFFKVLCDFAEGKPLIIPPLPSMDCVTHLLGELSRCADEGVPFSTGAFGVDAH